MLRDVQASLSGLGRWQLAAISFTSTLFMALGTPPDGVPALVWLGFIPLTLVARIVEGSRLKLAFFLGWVGGLCSGLVGFPWIALTLERFAGAPVPLAYLGLFAFAAWTAIPFGIWMVAVVRGPRTGWQAIVWPVVVWLALAEVWPALFPYTVVIGFALAPVWMQAAELGGVALVEAQVVVVGVLAADALLLSGRARTVRLSVAAAIPLVSYGLGAWRIATLDAEVEQARHVRFGIVQPNTPLMLPDRGEKLRRLHTMSLRAQDEGAQIIVWPEAGIFPFLLERPYEHDLPGYRSVLRFHDVPTVFGVATREPGGPYEYNSVAAMESDGDVVGLFDKNILVPFGEYIPIVDPEWAQKQIPAMSHNFAGQGPARFELQPAATPTRPEPAPIHLGPLVCYEDIFPGFAREVAAQSGGIDVFVNVTIDTWFGDTAEPWEHLGLAQFRSVEHRIPMVRSVAAGPASVVDVAGRLQATLDVTDPGLHDPVPAQRLVVDVALPRNTVERPTVYARGGWLLPWLCVGVSLMAPLLAYGRRRRRLGSEPP